MYLCLMYVCPDVSNSGGGDVPTSDVSKSAPSIFCTKWAGSLENIGFVVVIQIGRALVHN